MLVNPEIRWNQSQMGENQVKWKGTVGRDFQTSPPPFKPSLRTILSQHSRASLGENKTKPVHSAKGKGKKNHTNQIPNPWALSRCRDVVCVTPYSVGHKKWKRPLPMLCPTSCHTDEESQYTGMCTALPRQIFVAGIGPCLVAALTSTGHSVFLSFSRKLCGPALPRVKAGHSWMPLIVHQPQDCATLRFWLWTSDNCFL